MNRKLWICVLALALLCLFAGCREDQADVPAVETTEPTVEEATLPDETTLPEEETLNLPEGEGVESIDEVTQDVENTQPAETSPAAQEKPTDPAQKPTEAPAETEPGQTQSPETTPDSQPTQPSVTEEPTTPPATSTSCGCEYQKYMSMSAADQEAYMNSFGSPLAFVEWIKQAQAEHEAHDTTIKVEGGDLDIGDYINP